LFIKINDDKVCRVEFAGIIKQNCIYLFMELFYKYLMLLQILFEVFGIREFFPSNKVVRAMASHLCNHYVVRDLCENFVFLISGFDKHQMNIVSTFCSVFCGFLVDNTCGTMKKRNS